MPSLFTKLMVLSFLTLALGCKTDSDCSRLNVCISQECEHKELFPLGIVEYLGVFLVILLAGLSNAGGVGGGAIMTPILILLFGFLPHYAIPISQVIIFGGSLIAIAMKLQSRHPTRDKPLIFYDLILLTTSPLLLGISTGVMLNEILPSWVIELLLTIVLVYMTFNTSQK
jgi:uncharacterized membrane protein YfcA